MTTLCDLAIKAAKIAGEFIANFDKSSLKIEKKKSGISTASQIVTEVDYKSQELILNILEPTFNQYDIGLLIEEMVDNNSRLLKDYFWCIDPLDGTLPFTESIPGYSVSIALVAKNGKPVLGVVYDPSNDNLYHAIENKGAFKNNTPLSVNPTNYNKNLEFYINKSFTKHPKFSETIELLKEKTHPISESGININISYGAVMNACTAIEKSPSCYFVFPKKEKGSGSIWDYAATTCIYNELGANVSDIFGAPLELNNPNTTFMNERGILYASNTNIRNIIILLYKSFNAKIFNT